MDITSRPLPRRRADGGAAAAEAVVLDPQWLPPRPAENARRTTQSFAASLCANWRQKDGSQLAAIPQPAGAGRKTLATGSVAGARRSHGKRPGDAWFQKGGDRGRTSGSDWYCRPACVQRRRACSRPMRMNELRTELPERLGLDRSLRSQHPYEGCGFGGERFVPVAPAPPYRRALRTHPTSRRELLSTAARKLPNDAMRRQFEKAAACRGPVRWSQRAVRRLRRPIDKGAANIEAGRSRAANGGGARRQRG